MTGEWLLRCPHPRSRVQAVCQPVALDPKLDIDHLVPAGETLESLILTATEQRGGHRFYTITSVPHEDAAVVWGKEVLIVRDDYVLMEQQFWDQDGILVKKLEATEVKQMGGRSVASILRMGDIDSPEEWTQLTISQIEFDIELPAQMFTLSNLRNPRQ